MNRRRLLVARWVLLGAAAFAVVTAAVIAASPSAPRHDARERYACPMHPEVTASAPGECPICRMGLEPVWTLRADVQAGSSRMAEVSPLGSYIVRSVAFTDAVRAPAWLESEGTLTAHLYADELAALEAGAQGIFSPAIAPAVHVRAVLSPDTPSQWDCCTSRVHFHLDPDAANASVLRLGMAGWLRLAPKFRHAVMVPSTAVLQSPAGPYVFVASADRRSWVPRAVRLGKILFGNAVVVSGVGEQESVAVNGLFFADAERRLRRDPGIGPAP